ncbi:MAG: prephenate dehydrogenase/arogenate dehydrogenase family protein [Actinomycetota bacterium]|nr:prephenate dehydrogenase/arogenate dehydrogenase family protein [Actinomycetota bacterium]
MKKEAQGPFKPFEKTAILGVGLLGGSLALALRKKQLSKRISGYGRTEGNLKKALRAGMIDEYHMDPRKAVKGADLVVLATPVGMFRDLASEIKDAVEEGSIQTDVGSVKGALVNELESILPNFIGSHPISGGERPGVDNAVDGLFEGVRCIVTVTNAADKNALERMELMWRALGGNVELMDPDKHDMIYALMSHLPHVLAYSLVNTVGSMDGKSIKYAGQGFKDTTRIALSSPEVWRDICLLNGKHVISSIKAFRQELDKIEDAIAKKNPAALEAEFGRSRTLREKIDKKN